MIDYGDLLEHAWRLIWRHKFMLVLGAVITTLTALGDLTTPVLSLISDRALPGLPPGQPPALNLPPALERLPSLPDSVQMLRALFRAASAYGIGGWIAAILLVLFILILFAVAIIVARGALIAAANHAGTGDSVSVGNALCIGWRKAWRMIIIASIPPIPITIVLILIVIIATLGIQQAGGIEAIRSPGEIRRQLFTTLAMVSILLACPFAIATFALSLLRPFADRACIIEDTRALDSFRRGWSILRANLGSAAILLLFQFGIQAVAGSLLLLPRMLATLCFLIAPLLWILYGLLQAYLITLWTLAWRQWTASPAPIATTSES